MWGMTRGAGFVRVGDVGGGEEVLADVAGGGVLAGERDGERRGSAEVEEDERAAGSVGEGEGLKVVGVVEVDLVIAALGLVPGGIGAGEMDGDEVRQDGLVDHLEGEELGAAGVGVAAHVHDGSPEGHSLGCAVG